MLIVIAMTISTSVKQQLASLQTLTRIIWFSSGRKYVNPPWPRGLPARLGSERSGVQIPVKANLFFSNCLSQINIGSNISVAISFIANLLQLKR
jgi:hypothetical protein